MATWGQRLMAAYQPGSWAGLSQPGTDGWEDHMASTEGWLWHYCERCSDEHCSEPRAKPHAKPRAPTIYTSIANPAESRLRCYSAQGGVHIEREQHEGRRGGWKGRKKKRQENPCCDLAGRGGTQHVHAGRSDGGPANHRASAGRGRR